MYFYGRFHLRKVFAAAIKFLFLSSCLRERYVKKREGDKISVVSLPFFFFYSSLHPRYIRELLVSGVKESTKKFFNQPKYVTILYVVETWRLYKQ